MNDTLRSAYDRILGQTSGAGGVGLAQGPGQLGGFGQTLRTAIGDARAAATPESPFSWDTVRTAMTTAYPNFQFPNFTPGALQGGLQARFPNWTPGENRGWERFGNWTPGENRGWEHQWGGGNWTPGAGSPERSEGWQHPGSPTNPAPPVAQGPQGQQGLFDRQRQMLQDYRAKNPTVNVRLPRS